MLTIEAKNNSSRTVPFRFLIFGVPFARVISGLIFIILAFAMFTGAFGGVSEGATSSTLNFQARLLSSTGSLVPDGTYNVEFKIYDTAAAGASAQGVCSLDSSTDDCWWLETRTGGNMVTVKNGYMSVNLGSVTAFGSTINWDQEMWLTMNIGGSGAPSFDGEMSPRFKLTAVPYAFKAGQLAKRTGANTSTLDFAVQTGARSILLPDESGTLCIQSSTNCGFAASSGSANYIQNQNAGQQATSNFWISGTGRADTSLQTPLIDTATAVALNIGTTNATAINLNQNTTVAASKTLTVTSGATTLTGDTTGDALIVSNSTSIGNIAVFKDNATTVLSIANGGGVLFQNSANSNAGLEVKNSTAETIFLVDTTNKKVAVGNYIAGSTTGQFEIVPTSTSRVGLRVSGPTSYTANYIEVSSSVGGSADILRLQSNGNLQIGGGNFGTFGQSAASTNSVDTLLTSGNVSGANSNSGNVIFRSGTSTTSGNTGSVGIQSGAATSGNSGDIYIDSGTASGTTGNITIGTVYASALTLGRTGLTTTNAGALTVAQLFTGNLGVTVLGATTSINASSNFATNINTGDSTGAVSIGNSLAGAITVQSASTIGLTGTTTVTGLTTGDALTVNNSTSTGNILNVQDNGTNVLVVVDGGNVGLQTGASAPNYSLSFGQGANRTIGVETQGTAATAGNNLTVSAGTGNTSGAGGSLILQGGTGGTSGAGGVVTIQGGTAGGGSNNGGNLNLTGGTGTGAGVTGLVVINTPAYSTVSNTTCGVSCTITQANVDSYSAILVNASTTSLTITMPDPTITTAGRTIYITGADNTSDFTLRLNSGGTLIDISMRENTTATLIWNGSDWTAAGASSSTDLQAAYNNTLTSAGGAELVLAASGGNADGLTIRNNSTTAITGGLLEVQTSIGSNLFSVNNNATEYANNGGAETAGASSTTFPASTWSASPTGGSQATVSRTVTAGEFATGQAGVKIVTTGATTADQGAADQIAVNGTNTALTENLVYTVAFTVKGTTNFSTLDVVYSRDGTNTSTTSCATAQTVTQSIWSRITCSFTAPSSGITSSNAIFIRQSNSNSAAKTFYIDNLSVNINASTTHAADGSVDSALGTNWTSFDADGGAGTTSLLRDTTTIYDTSGSVQDTVTNHANLGLRNNLTITPSVSTQYLVTFYAKSSTAWTDVTVGFLPAGGNSTPSAAQLCTDYNTQTVSTSTWTKITCIFTAPSSGISDPDVVIYQPTAPGAGRVFYVDAMTVTLNTNNSSSVQIGGGNQGGPATLFTLDRSSGVPIASNNDAYLGSMYYDTSTGRIQCYESDGWGACGAAPDNIVNLNPEYAGAVLNGTGIGTMTADFCAEQGGVLNVNTSLCDTGQAKNYYKWTSPQATQQTYSIYVTYQLPATFNGFSSDDTVQLVARTDSLTNADVTYEMFKSTGSAVTACGTATTVVTTVDTWQSVGVNGNESTGCSFSSSSASNFIIFKINMKANSNANAYVSTLSFTTTGR